MGNQLKVYLHEKYQGDIFREKNGRYSFHPASIEITERFGICPISFSFFKTWPRLHHDRINTFLNNLKSENERWIKKKGFEYKFDPKDTFSYFEHFGLDCAGAIQFIKPGEEENIYRNNDALIPITRTEIGEELTRIQKGQETEFITDRQRLSIAGAENKIGLTKLSEKWYISNGTIPSTHIIKFLTIDQREQHISEFLSLKIIEKLLPTGAISQCEYAELAGLSCIISSRYDREINGNSIKRIHQEDFCQILGIDPEIKYEMHGGPNATRIIDVINKYSHAPEADTKLFASCLFLNYLMMCPDGHGKNYSMLIKEEYFRLAPIYDFTSIAYLDTSKIKDGLKETAMGIDGKRKYNTISGDNILRFFHKNNLPLEEYIPMIMEYCTKLPEIIEQTMAEYSNLGISDSFRSNFTSNIGKSSRHLLEQIQKISPKQK